MVTKDRTYKCLSPVGIQDPVDLYPLAPRLDRFDGKTIMFNMMVNVEQEFLTPLEKMLRGDYMVPAVDDPYQNCIIVSGGGEETSHWVNGRTPNADPAYCVDAWRRTLITCVNSFHLT